VCTSPPQTAVAEVWARFIFAHTDYPAWGKKKSRTRPSLAANATSTFSRWHRGPPLAACCLLAPPPGTHPPSLYRDPPHLP
jgi:hypothetical protein